VACDWVRFKDLVAVAQRSSPEDAIEAYREALALVRGEPFADVAKATFVWAWSEGLVYEMQLAVAKAADALGQLALGEGDPETARWATRQGLAVSPAQQSLFRVEMRAAAELGDVEAMDRSYQAAQRAQQLVDPLTGVPEETAELYKHLMARCRVMTNGGAMTDGGATTEGRAMADARQSHARQGSNARA
jgi:two-component SAPR family response regulator